MFSPVESNQGFNFKPELPTSSAYYRLLKKLRRQVGHAIRDFKMIEEGDKVMVCISVVRTVIPCSILCCSLNVLHRSILMWWL